MKVGVIHILLTPSFYPKSPQLHVDVKLDGTVRTEQPIHWRSWDWAAVDQHHHWGPAPESSTIWHTVYCRDDNKSSYFHSLCKYMILRAEVSSFKPLPAGMFSFYCKHIYSASKVWQWGILQCTVLTTSTIFFSNPLGHPISNAKSCNQIGRRLTTCSHKGNTSIHLLSL